MKKGIHPDYQDILFVDTATGHKFVCGAALKPKEEAEFEGKKYPVYNLHISSASHPFFTGTDQMADTEGRIDKFRKRYAKAAEKKPQEEQAPAPAAPSKGAKVVKARAKPKTDKPKAKKEVGKKETD